jgi:hypothetical protein
MGNLATLPDGTVVRDEAGVLWFLCTYAMVGSERPVRRAVPVNYDRKSGRVIMIMREFIEAHPRCEVVYRPREPQRDSVLGDHRAYNPATRAMQPCPGSGMRAAEAAEADEQTSQPPRPV